jgi:hypothetical protein
MRNNQGAFVNDFFFIKINALVYRNEHKNFQWRKPDVHLTSTANVVKCRSFDFVRPFFVAVDRS